MKEIVKQTSIIAVVMVLFSFMIILFTPYPIMEFMMKKREDQSELVKKISSTVKVDTVLYQENLLNRQTVTVIYETGREKLKPIFYFRTLQEKESGWLDENAKELTAEGYALVVINQTADMAYHRTDYQKKFDEIRNRISKYFKQNNRSLADSLWVTEGIGSKILEDYLVSQSNSKEQLICYNPYFDFSAYSKNHSSLSQQFFISKFSKAYGEKENSEGALVLKPIVILTKDKDDTSVVTSFSEIYEIGSLRLLPVLNQL